MRYLLFSIFLLSSLLSAAQQKWELSDCLQYAMQHQNSIKKANLEVALQDQKNKEIIALTRPQISASGMFNYLFLIPKQRSDANAFNFGDAFSFFKIDTPAYIAYQAQPKDEYSVFQFGLPLSVSGNVQANQILFDPQVFVGLQARNQLMQLARLNLQRSEEELKINVSKAFYNCLIAEKRMEILKENIELIGQVENTTSKLFNEGFVEKVDVLRLTVQKNNLIAEQTKVQNLIDLGYYLLKFQMGMPLQEEINLTAMFDEASIKKDILLEQNIDYQQRTEMKLLDLAKDLNELDYKRYQLSYLPTLVAFGQFGYASQMKRLKEIFTLPYFPTGAVGLQLNVPIYGGGQRNAKLQQSKIGLQKNDYDIETFKQAMEFEVNNARTALRNNLLTLDNQKANIDLAEKVYEISKKKYKEGLGSNLEIIQAQTALREAQTNYYATLFEAMLSKIELQKALGIYK